MPSANEFWKRANFMVVHLDSIITTKYVFFSLSLKTWKTKREWFLYSQPPLPPTQMNNKKKTLHPVLSPTSTSINADSFIPASYNDDKTKGYVIFLIWNNKTAVWSKKGTEEERDSSSQQRPCHMIDPPVLFSVCRIWHPCCLNSFRNSNEINTMINLLSVLTQTWLLITIFFLLFVNIQFVEIPTAAQTWLNKNWK
jgi:hypothetical protein